MLLGAWDALSVFACPLLCPCLSRCLGVSWYPSGPPTPVDLVVLELRTKERRGVTCAEATARSDGPRHRVHRVQDVPLRVEFAAGPLCRRRIGDRPKMPVSRSRRIPHVEHNVADMSDTSVKVHREADHEVMGASTPRRPR